MPVEIRAVRSVSRLASAALTLVSRETVEARECPVDPALVDRAGFEGRAGQIQLWPDEGRSLGLVGLGASADLDSRAIRRAGGVLARACWRHHRIAVELGETALSGWGIAAGEAHRALAEGIELGRYRYTAMKSAPEESKLRRVDVAGRGGTKAQAALDRGALISGGQCLARDLVNEPGGSLTAPVLARRTAEMGRSAGLRVKVWTEAEIKRRRLGGLLGVNRGSTQPPRFTELSYEPVDQATATLALVGKGLTFDAGGLSIKSSTGMMSMKKDMGGAAAVIGAMSVMAAAAVPVRVKAFLPMTDNMLGGDATRPGDVLTIRNGKTIEVLNTDAEGRLVLADALSLASEARPDAIVDLATLTGACMVALGPSIAGLMGNNQAWIDQVAGAAAAAGERVWQLPLPDDYKAQFESTVADMKNIGGPHGGALTAGLILQEFVAVGIPWAHLDIAGPAYSESDDGEICKGGTGFGVRTLVELAAGFVAPAAPANQRAG